MNQGKTYRSIKFILILSLIVGYLPSRTYAAGNALDPSNFTSLGNLVLANGSLIFNTDTGTWNLNGTEYSGGVLDPGGSGLRVFTFSDINISAGTTTSYTGSRPLALLSKDTISIGGALNMDGAQIASGQGDGSTAPANGGGGGGAGFANLGGEGGSGSGPGGLGGIQYGANDLSSLSTFPMGSRGGRGDICVAGSSTGGAGGGGIVLSALGTVSLMNGSVISVRGNNGDIPQTGNAGNGGGSGGAILIIAPRYLDNSGVTIRVSGGNGSSAIGLVFCPSAKGGGGGASAGRIALVTGSAPGAIMQSSGGLGGLGVNGGGVGTTGPAGTIFTRSFLALDFGMSHSVGVVVPFTATLPIGSASNYAWDFGDGTNANTPIGTTNHTFSSIGTFTVVVTATMTGTGVTTSKSTNITMTDVKVYLPFVMR